LLEETRIHLNDDDLERTGTKRIEERRNLSVLFSYKTDDNRSGAHILTSLNLL
jgi:hypothetical protein